MVGELALGKLVLANLHWTKDLRPLLEIIAGLLFLLANKI